MRFANVVSLGFFCSVASELEKQGLRDGSYPFDWVISDVDSVATLITNGFSGLLDIDSLFRDRERPDIVHHKHYGVDFYHDFSVDQPLAEEVGTVREKYQRRISRFYRSLQSPTLLVRYIEDGESGYWYHEAGRLMAFLTDRNPKNRVLLIANSDTPLDTDQLVEGVLAVIRVERDIGDTVARKFLDRKATAKQMAEIGYPVAKRLRNYHHFHQKSGDQTMGVFPFFRSLGSRLKQGVAKRLFGQGREA